MYNASFIMNSRKPDMVAPSQCLLVVSFRDARSLVMLTYLSGAIHRREVVIVIELEWRMQIRFF